jgi:hypothetical protein
MPTSQEGAKLDRRAIGRTMINRAVSMYFLGQDLVHASRVRDVTNHGAGIQLNGLNIVPSEFGWHLIRQFSHDAPVPVDLALRRLCRCGVRKLTPYPSKLSAVRAR